MKPNASKFHSCSFDGSVSKLWQLKEKSDTLSVLMLIVQDLVSASALHAFLCS